jgi:all-trans-retinol 13,14-reductase
MSGSDDQFDAVVIGAGIGGLVTGAALAAAGRRVLVAEATDRIGGYQCRIRTDANQFEPHFHFLQEAGPGRLVAQLLEDLGIALRWRRVDPLLRLSFPDQTIVIPTERAAYIEMLRRAFPHETRGITALFAATKNIYDAASNMPTLSPVLIHYAADTVETFLARFVTDPRLVTVAGAWAAYFGYGASQIAAVAIAVFTECCFDGGVFHPVGGIFALTDALRRAIEARGGMVALSTPVASIVVENDSVTGVFVDGGRHVRAPVVVSTAGAVETLRDLARLDGGPARRLATTEHFRSPFTVMLHVRAGIVAGDAGAPVQVVFPGYDTAAQDRAQLAGVVEEAPVSIGIPTTVNPELAPAGSATVLLYTFVSAAQIDRLLVDEQLADEYAQRLVGVAARALPGLRDGIIASTTTVADLRSIYGATTKGALGWAPNPQTLLGGPHRHAIATSRIGSAFLKAAVRCAPRTISRLASGSALPGPGTSVKGLYLAGQWTETGPGMNNVCRSAQRAVALIEAGGP